MNLKRLAQSSWGRGLSGTVEERKSVREELLETCCFNLVLVRLDVGQGIPPHPEPCDVCFHVVEGSGTFTVGGEKADLSAGEMVFAPANASGRSKMQRAGCFGRTRTSLGGFYGWSMQ